MPDPSVRRFVLTACFLLLSATAAPATAAPAAVERNVVYGMYSGLALLMDVHRPDKPNGYGVIAVSGSGWHAPLGLDAAALKTGNIQAFVPSLLAGGYTVFAINHRAAPRFRHPAALEDVQRAVRFVRHHARQWQIDPARLAGVGGSSGGHLLALAATLAAPGSPADHDPVNRQPATLQALVLRAPPTDLLARAATGNPSMVVSYLGGPPGPADDPSAPKAYRDASPITHLSPATPPTLFIHGDADESVPFQQSVAMEARLRQLKVPAKLVRIPGGAHGPTFGPPDKVNPQWPDYNLETVRWLDRYLKVAAAGAAKPRD